MNNWSLANNFESVTISKQSENMATFASNAHFDPCLATGDDWTSPLVRDDDPSIYTLLPVLCNKHKLESQNTVNVNDTTQTPVNLTTIYKSLCSISDGVNRLENVNVTANA